MDIFMIGEEELTNMMGTLSNLAILKMLHDRGCDVKGFTETYHVEYGRNESWDILFGAASFFFEESEFFWHSDLSEEQIESLEEYTSDNNEAECYISLKGEKIRRLLEYNQEDVDNLLNTIFDGDDTFNFYYLEYTHHVTDSEILLAIYFVGGTCYELANSMAKLHDKFEELIKRLEEMKNDCRVQNNRHIA